MISAKDRKWQYFVGASAVIYFGGLVMVLIGRLFYTIIKKSTRRTRSIADINAVVPTQPNVKVSSDDEEDASWYVALKEGAGALVSAQTLQGRILVGLYFHEEFYFMTKGNRDPRTICHIVLIIFLN